MRWSNTSESNLSECFSVVIMWGYFHFHHGPLWDPKYHFQNPRIDCSQTASWSLSYTSVRWTHRSERSFTERFSLVIMWRCFLFHHSPQWAPKYTFAEFMTTALENCSKKGMVELCVMKSHIRKQSLIKLLSSCYVRIFPFSPWAPKGSQISLCRFQEKSVSKLLPEV